MNTFSFCDVGLNAKFGGVAYFALFEPPAARWQCCDLSLAPCWTEGGVEDPGFRVLTTPSLSRSCWLKLTRHIVGSEGEPQVLVV